MKKSLTILLLIFYFIAKAQSFKETQQWISNNAKADNPSVNQQVYYSVSKKMIYFIEIVEHSRGYHSYISSVFDPKKATSISIDKDVDGEFNLTLWFYESTMVNTLVISDTPPYTGTYLTDDYLEKLNVKAGIKRRAIDIHLYCDIDQITRVKKAYIHLFKTLGHTIKDEDNMF